MKPPTSSSKQHRQLKVFGLSDTNNAQANIPENSFDWHQIDSLKFIFQMILTTAIIMLCASQLASQTDSSDKAIYWSGITSTLAWWMPSPGSNKETK